MENHDDSYASATALLTSLTQFDPASVKEESCSEFALNCSLFSFVDSTVNSRNLTLTPILDTQISVNCQSRFSQHPEATLHKPMYTPADVKPGSMRSFIIDHKTNVEKASIDHFQRWSKRGQSSQLKRYFYAKNLSRCQPKDSFYTLTRYHSTHPDTDPPNTFHRFIYRCYDIRKRPIGLMLISYAASPPNHHAGIQRVRSFGESMISNIVEADLTNAWSSLFTRPSTYDGTEAPWTMNKVALEKWIDENQSVVEEVRCRTSAPVVELDQVARYQALDGQMLQRRQCRAQLSALREVPGPPKGLKEWQHQVVHYRCFFIACRKHVRRCDQKYPQKDEDFVAFASTKRCPPSKFGGTQFDNQSTCSDEQSNYSAPVIRDNSADILQPFLEVSYQSTESQCDLTVTTPQEELDLGPLLTARLNSMEREQLIALAQNLYVRKIEGSDYYVKGYMRNVLVNNEELTCSCNKQQFGFLCPHVLAVAWLTNTMEAFTFKANLKMLEEPASAFVESQRASGSSMKVQTEKRRLYSHCPY